MAESADSGASVGRCLGFGVLLAGLCLFIGLTTGLLGAPDPDSSPATSASPVDRVLAIATGQNKPTDDLTLLLPSGARVKSSNYNGVQIAGTTYYYNLAPRQSFDPLGRGDLTSEQIRVVRVVGDMPNRVMVYTAKAGIPVLDGFQTTANGRPGHKAN